MTNEIVLAGSNSIIRTYDEVERVAKAMAASGYFQDAKSISQAIVKIMAGSEIGFGPFASMQGVNIIKGKPSYNANMLASSVKAHPKYDYRIIKLDDTICELAFFEGGTEVGRPTFTLQDAQKAGTTNLDKFPRNMLFARAMSNGVRWYCPDVTNGNAVYTPEELGAEVDEDGNVIEGESVTITEPVIEIEAEIEEQPDSDPMTIERAFAIENSEGVKYGDLPSDKLSKMSIGIGKGLQKDDLTPVEKQEYLDKQDAIKVILQARSDGSL